MAEPSIKDLAYRTAAGVFGGPVDLATMVMRPFGYKTPDEQVFGSSEYIGKKLEDVGLVSSARAPITEFLTSMAVPTPGGIAKGAALAAPMIGGMFVGKGAKTWDALQASKAKMLADMGTDARTIWQQTGTWKGPDGKWRQEISDDLSRIGSRVQQDKTVADISGRAMFDKSGGVPQMGDVLRHDDLYKSYPVMKDIGLEFDGTLGGAYSAENLKLGGPGTVQLGYEVKGTSTPLHEIQHAIQQREGFAKGGSMDEFTNYTGALERARLNNGIDPVTGDADFVIEEQIKNFGVDPFDAYRRLAGEAEARAVQKRRNMTPEQRQAMFPEESYDVPINELIIRGVVND